MVADREVEVGKGSTSYGFRCPRCGEFSGYGMTQRAARAAWLVHIGHVPHVRPLRAPGFGGRGGWAYELSCSCAPAPPLGDPMPHRMNASLRHGDHVQQSLNERGECG